MNVTTDPWIPVVYDDGTAVNVSLVTAYRDADSIRDLAVNPPQRVSLMRLLVCITQRALDGPEDEEDWFGCRDRIIPASIDYLERYGESFELYGDRPFLQATGLEATWNAVVDKLDFRLSAGNNPTLFDQESIPGGRNIGDAERALLLLTYQCFSPGGLIGSAQWNGVHTGRSSEHAPCIEGSMLHALLRKESLANTVHLNLLPRDYVETSLKYTWGTPVWEAQPQSPESESAHKIVTSYLGRLVPLTRAILLDPDSPRCTLVNGLTYPKLPEAREPCATVIQRKQGSREILAYVRVDLDKHPWRMINSLLALDGKGIQGGAPALKHLQTMHANGGETNVDVWTGGIAASKSKILDVAEWTFNIDIDMLSDSVLQSYQIGVDGADRASQCLNEAVKRYCGFMNRENTLSGGARKHFWSRLDREYPVLMDAAERDDAYLNETWYPVVRDAMNAAYEFACPKETPRQMEAYAVGLKRLRLRKFGEQEPVA